MRPHLINLPQLLITRNRRPQIMMQPTNAPQRRSPQQANGDNQRPDLIPHFPPQRHGIIVSRCDHIRAYSRVRFVDPWRREPCRGGFSRRFGKRMIDWEGIVSRDGPAVWRTAYRLLGNRADADECFQETFLAALSFSRRSIVDNWGALLHRLATARAIDRLRQRQRRSTRQEMLDFESVNGHQAEPYQNAQAG